MIRTVLRRAVLAVATACALLGAAAVAPTAFGSAATAAEAPLRALSQTVAAPVARAVVRLPQR